MRRIVFAFLVVLFAGSAHADPTPGRIDALFSAWDKPDSPGAALAVVRDGKIVYSRGYGQAHLEYDVPVTPRTVFHVASVSKQFTAFAIQLLAQEGKLSLDDEVRKHLPELQVKSPTPITIRHLLHHTSGLRDQWNLLVMAGRRLDDVITEEDLLNVIWRQRELNFAPGEEELYSNTGYTLLGLIVKRVSGQSLAAFAKARIFEPLGMKNTHFHENYGTLVKGRAYSYQRVEGSWRYVALSYSNTGATSLFTTVEDLALWEHNFATGRVGGTAVVQAMLRPGRLNSGRETTYASGVFVGKHRGLPVVEHSGSDAGFRAHVLRYPEQKLSVIVLGNAAELNATRLAREVVDLYLEGTPGLQAGSANPPEIETDAREIAAYLGEFQMFPGFFLKFSVEGNRLMVQATGQQRFPLSASAPGRFFMRAVEASVVFDPPTGGTTQGATWKQGGRETQIRRVVREPVSTERMTPCLGTFYSDELRTAYRLNAVEGKLWVVYPRGRVELQPVHGDHFNGGFPLGTVSFQRDAAGACDNFTASNGRVRNLKFRRLALGD